MSAHTPVAIPAGDLRQSDVVHIAPTSPEMLGEIVHRWNAHEGLLAALELRIANGSQSKRPCNE